MKMKMHPRIDEWSPRTTERYRKQTIEGFLKHGSTRHSGMALTLPFVVNHCEENGIPYRLTAHPGQGYYIERMEPL